MPDFPSMFFARKGYLYKDHAEITFTDTQTSYTIGTNAHTADPSKPESFIAHELLVFADKDCYIRFDGPTQVQERVPAKVFMLFRPLSSVLYVVRVSENGTLLIWAEG